MGTGLIGPARARPEVERRAGSPEEAAGVLPQGRFLQGGRRAGEWDDGTRRTLDDLVPGDGYRLLSDPVLLSDP